MSDTNSEQVTCRRLLASDLVQVLALQKANLLANIDQASAKEGFIQGEFSEDEFLKINERTAVAVASVKDEFAGYICTFALEDLISLPLPQFAVLRFESIKFHGKPLSNWRLIFTGPICIEPKYRGHGVFSTLYNYVFDILSKPAANFEAAVAIIDDANPRSLAAHKRHAAMQVVDQWSFGARHYKTVARRL